MTDASPTPQRAVLLIGGPDAGKSNFLFRLWIALSSGGGALVKDGLPDEAAYLRAGAERLFEGEFASRTSKEVHEHVFIPVLCTANCGDNSGGILAVPDVPGEQVLAVYRNRQWSKAWEDRISSRCGCLLFVRAGSSEDVTPLDWATCFEKYGGPPPKPVNVGASVRSTVSTVHAPGDEGKFVEQPEPGVEAQSLKDDTPTQVILTEWLQFLRLAFTEKAGGAFRPRVGIVVSAWDVVHVEMQAGEPSAYILENFPMLHQFVEANTEYFDFQYFGVTIVDGDLNNDEDFKKTYSEGTPQDFGKVIHSLNGKREESKDMTLPVAWALRLLPGFTP